MLIEFPFLACELTELEREDVENRHHPHFAKSFPKGIRVDRTVCGLGVFAVRKYREGARIGRVRGKIFADPDYSSNYCIDAGGSMSLEPAAPFCFLNHSCEPNCQLLNYIDENEWDDTLRRKLAFERANRPQAKKFAGTDAAFGVELWLETLRDIEPHEQLTIDYAWTEDRAIPCLCGSPKCRGWIIAEELLEEFLASRKTRKYSIAGR
ncbi:MAG: SET domain-containing protein-lysine N-methyltransferase [Planctomycetaceae bacterium]|nr:SET domain-containing protein-lysine N-methyltransferase [Planctomycetaceae bacterium]